MKTWKKVRAGLALTPRPAPAVRAQQGPIFNVPGVPPGTNPAVLAQNPAGAPPSPFNPLSLLCPSPEQILMLKMKFCMCPLGQLLNNGLAPIGFLTGGLFGP